MFLVGLPQYVVLANSAWFGLVWCTSRASVCCHFWKLVCVDRVQHSVRVERRILAPHGDKHVGPRPSATLCEDAGRSSTRYFPASLARLAGHRAFDSCLPRPQRADTGLVCTAVLCLLGTAGNDISALHSAAPVYARWCDARESNTTSLVAALLTG